MRVSAAPNLPPAPALVIWAQRRGSERKIHRSASERSVSSQARVSLGYLSEVERGQKEASSELLASICQALDAPLSMVLREVSDRIALTEGVMIPDTVPDELVRQQGVALR